MAVWLKVCAKFNLGNDGAETCYLLFEIRNVSIISFILFVKKFHSLLR